MTTNFDIYVSIQRCAEIEDELSSLGVSKLLDEKEELKKSIKQWLILQKKENSDLSYWDETSNWVATLSERTKDEWNIDNFKGILSDKQQKRYLKEDINKDSIKEGISNGDLSRPLLELKEAVSKTHQSYVLHIKEKINPQEEFSE